MQISISGQHFDVTPATDQHVTEKLKPLDRYMDYSASAHVVLHLEKTRCLAEGTITAKGIRLHSPAEAKDMYGAIDSMANRLERQILKHKNKISSHHRDEGALKTKAET